MEDGWSLILHVLSDILAQDQRSSVAGSATHVLFTLLQAHSAAWSVGAWHVMQHRVMPHLFKVRGARGGGAGGDGGGQEA